MLFRSKKHKQLYCNYRKWLTAKREDLCSIRNDLTLLFPDLWEEIVGQCEGLKSSDLDFANDITLNGLISCMLDEADKTSCSTVILSSDTGYTMVHSEECGEECGYTMPLVVSDVVLDRREDQKRFLSISHPFQLFGSAAGLNTSFAVQGNSIGCTARIRKLAQKNIPKTVISRKFLEMDRPEEAANLYRAHSCSLPNHHMFIMNEGVFSLKVRLGKSAGEENDVRLNKIDLTSGELICQTNHFQDEDLSKSPWVYKDDPNESTERLAALNEAVIRVSNSSELESKFQHFLRTHPANDLKRTRLQDMVSGIFSFHVAHTGPPYYRSVIFSYGWGL